MDGPVPLAKRLRLSPSAYRIVTLVALILLAAIIVSGGAVRLTGSGLGCPDWPTCANGQLATHLFAEGAGHKTIESLNRYLTGLVSLIVITSVLASLVRGPRRMDLVWLSLSLVGGVIGQIVLGGITVLTHLNPVAVQSHFLLSIVLVTCAVLLHERAGRPDDRPPRPAASRALGPSFFALALLVPVIAAGTVLTGTGPHGGSPDAQRFALHPPSVARVHGVLVEVFTVALLYAVFRAWRSGASPATLTRGSVAIGVAIAQSVLGYTQYFTGVPALLVGVHIAGATALWIAVLKFHVSVVSGSPSLSKSPEPVGRITPMATPQT